ncbi:MAG: type IV pilus assembly protein PilM [Halomonas sp.]|nr:type IV pilus assembly protein PilM [Halomonas sp.]TVP46278.1 MAG: type IV pilus assembly protein PilM [Halomonas sp.]
MRFLGTGKRLIGVDITSAAVKLLELKKCHTYYQVESYAIMPLHEGAVVERRICDMDSVSSVLIRAIEYAKPSTRKAIVAVPANTAITKMLSFPIDLSEEEIEAQIITRYDQFLPFPFNEAAFDFQCLGPAPFDEKLQQVLLVACKQRDVTQLTDTLERAGLEPSIVEVETFAIERALAELYGQLKTENEPAASVGFVDIGANTTAFHVVRDGQIVYSRDTLFGGRQLTEAIRQCHGVSMEEADIAKKLGELPSDYHAKVVSPFVGTVVQDIRRSLQLYYSAGRQQEVKHIVLAGGSSVIPGLAERMAEGCDMPVTMANPFQRMQVNKRLNQQALMSAGPAMLTASGLAIRMSQ